MSENKNVWRLETAAIAWAAVLISGPLLIAPPFTHFLRCGVPGCEIAPDHEYQQIRDWITSMGGVTDWLLVVVGILQWRIYTKQAVILTRQTETLPRIERAYVFAEVRLVRGIDSFPGGFVSVQFAVRFKNHGRTPAIILAVYAKPEVLDSAPQIMPHEEIEIPPSLVIGPGGDYEGFVNITTKGKTWCSPDDAPTQALYCSGFIRYRDILGDEQKTGFCWRYAPLLDKERLSVSHATPLNFFT